MLKGSRDVVLGDVVRPLEDVDVKTSRHVPGDVAVERPDTGVVKIELHNDVRGRRTGVSGRRQNVDVATLRVAGVGDNAVPGAKALREDIHVVAVHVHCYGLVSEVITEEFSWFLRWDRNWNLL